MVYLQCYQPHSSMALPLRACRDWGKRSIYFSHSDGARYTDSLHEWIDLTFIHLRQVFVGSAIGGSQPRYLNLDVHPAPNALRNAPPPLFMRAPQACPCSALLLRTKYLICHPKGHRQQESAKNAI